MQLIKSSILSYLLFISQISVLCWRNWDTPITLRYGWLCQLSRRRRTMWGLTLIYPTENVLIELSENSATFERVVILIVVFDILSQMITRSDKTQHINILIFIWHCEILICLQKLRPFPGIEVVSKNYNSKFLPFRKTFTKSLRDLSYNNKSLRHLKAPQYRMRTVVSLESQP